MSGSNSLEVINFCSEQTQWWDQAATVYAKCVDVVLMIEKVKFLHCLPEANSVTHELARHSIMNKLSCTWDDDPLSFFFF